MVMINRLVIRIFQLLVALFFTFVGLLWFGALLLIPLALWANFIDLLVSPLGFNSLFAAVISIPVIIAIIFYLYRIPGLTETLLDIGLNIVKLGTTNFQRMDEMANTVKARQKTPARKIKISLHE